MVVPSSAAPNDLPPSPTPPGPGPSTLAARRLRVASPPPPKTSTPIWPDSLGGPLTKSRAGIHHVLSLHIRQQPERARLCSYKEENDTMDRRPVDPPPVLELRAKSSASSDILDSACFFIRASLVDPDPAPDPAPPGDAGDGGYDGVRMPGGGDATAVEIIQTPEKLKDMEGETVFMCIFAKLSVRLPGVFRLKFTLFETANGGVTAITHTVSDTFEVFSPKLFKGMHESTKLTRHLAAQGLKVKLRTDPASGKQARRRSQAARDTPTQSPMPMAPPPNVSPSRIPNLVWPPIDHSVMMTEPGRGPEGAWQDEGDGKRKVRRIMGRDDGYFASALPPDVAGRSKLSRTPSRDGMRPRQQPLQPPRALASSSAGPGMDLSGYSLVRAGSGAGPAAGAGSAEPRRGASSRSSVSTRTNSSTNPSLLSLRSTSNTSSSMMPPPATPMRYTGNRFGLPPGDDGLGILPLPPINAFASGSSLSSGWSIAQPAPQVVLPPLTNLLPDRPRADPRPSSTDPRPVLPPLHFLANPRPGQGRDPGFPR
ncbi:hypothetical protein Q5752_000787 [Cryptotrichosporon argae]